LQNVRFQMNKPDLCPALILDYVADAALNGLSVQASHEAESALRFINSKHALLTATRVLTPVAVFLQLEGAGNEGIIVEGGDLSRAALPVAFKSGVTEQAVKLRS
jgi:hypothetical protein